MILPPFFGFSTKYNETYIYHAIHDYLSADILTYTDPVPRAIVTYLNFDILTYNKTVSQNILLSYLTNDILFYSLPSINQPSLISYINCDILCYELPPGPPYPIQTLLARDKDSSGLLMWSPPDNNKSTINSYILEYKNIDDISWTLYSNSINSGLSNISIPLINNNTYVIRMAAINNIGTGEFTLSNTITPSGGVDNDCDLIFYTNLDSTDRNFIASTGCNGFTDIYVTDYVTTGILGSGAFSNYWYFPGNLTTLTNNPHIGLTTYPHMHSVHSGSNPWSLSGNFTISFWFKPDNATPTSGQTLLACSSESGNNHSWKIYHINNTIAFATGNKDNLQDIIVATGLNISTSSFSNIAISRSNNYISLFVTGVEKAEIYSNINLSINSQYLVIGGYPHTGGYSFSTLDGWGLTTEGFVGGIDEITISRSAFYRGNFSPPISARNTANLNCDCVLPEAPNNLQVIYIED